MTSIDHTQTSDASPQDQRRERGDREASRIARVAVGVAAVAVVAALLSRQGLGAGLAVAATIAGVVQMTALSPPFSRRASRAEAAGMRWARSASEQALQLASASGGYLRSAWWRARRRELAATFVVCSSLVAPIYLRLAHNSLAQVITNNDVYLHIRLADQSGLWPIKIPHPVFHSLYLMARPLIGAQWAPLVPVLVATALMAAGLMRLGATPAYGRQALRGGAVVAFAAAVILTDTPTILLSATGLIEPTPVMLVHMWWSPTALLLFGSSLLLIPYLAELIAAAPPTSPTHGRLRKLGLLVLALAVLSTLSRPNLTFALVPGLLICLMRTRSWQRATLGAAIRWFIIPAGLVYVWQTSVVLANYQNTQSGLAINPFHVMALSRMFVHPWFFYISAVPTIAAALVGRRRFTREPVVFLTTQSLWFATALMILVDDTAIEQNAHGIYVLPVVAVWLVLWVLTVRFWVGELIASRRAGPAEARKFRLILAGSTVWVAAGVISHLTAMGVHKFAIV